MPPCQLLETALYVGDVAHACDFYRTLFEFEVMTQDDRFCALSIADRSVLLLFRRGATCSPILTAGGIIPPHDGSGQTHLAFAISATELPVWEARLAEQGIPLESRVTWPRGGTSLYFRDPDQHLVELATPGIWPIY